MPHQHNERTVTGSNVTGGVKIGLALGRRVGRRAQIADTVFCSNLRRASACFRSTCPSSSGSSVSSLPGRLLRRGPGPPNPGRKKIPLPPTQSDWARARFLRGLLAGQAPLLRLEDAFAGGEIPVDGVDGAIAVATDVCHPRIGACGGGNSLDRPRSGVRNRSGRPRLGVAVTY